jgi:hypothetical protein
MNMDTPITEILKSKRKRPRGRPKSPEVSKYPINNWFRSSAAQRLRWARAAKRAGMPLRTWIRIKLDDGAEAQEARERGGAA